MDNLDKLKIYESENKKNVTKGMKSKRTTSVKLMQEIYGLLYLNLKLKLEHHTCFTKIIVIVNRINKI